MSNNRRPWGEDVPSSLTEQKAKQGQQSSFHTFILIVMGLIPAALILLSNISIGAWPGTPKNIALYNRVALAILIILFIEGFIIQSKLPPGNSSARARTTRVLLLFFAAGILIAAGLFLAIAYLAPYSTISERLVLPILIFIFFTVLSVFSPFMPIWPVHVPDGELWATFDNTGQLKKYMGQFEQSGDTSTGNTRHLSGIIERSPTIRPIDEFKFLAKAGVITIKETQIDDSTFMSLDGYLFRVTIDLMCMFNPLKADESVYLSKGILALNNLAGILEKEIMYIVRDSIRRYTRTELEDGERLPQIRRSISNDIKELIEGFKPMGVSLPNRPGVIKVIIEPHETLTEARQRRASIDALLANEDTDRINVRINEGGAIYTELKTEDATKNDLGTIMTGLVSLLADAVRSQQRQIPAEDTPPELPPGSPPPPPGGGGGGTVPPTPDPQPAPQPEDVPSSDQQPYDEESEESEEFVVTEEEDGVFRVRRNPIYPDSFDEDESESS